MNNPKLTKEEREMKETSLLLTLLEKEKESIAAPKELLEKILEKNRILSGASGRTSAWEKINNLINNLNFMDKKLKYAVSILGVVIILVVGIIALDNGQKPSEVATQKSTTETKLVTNSPIIGDEKIDESINEILNEALDDSEFESELAEIELALADEEILNEINNLINDDEL